MNSEIIVVSGLPRSGTSLMMQMLKRGGIEIATDEQRTPDEDNPHGYYEMEAVKRLHKDASWIPEVRGKAIKVISQLLFSLPSEESYRIILMERDLEEVLASQSVMLARSGKEGAEKQVGILRKAFTNHLARLEEWLPAQEHLKTLRLRYPQVVANPLETATEVAAFLQGPIDPAQMAAAVDPSLYRNRT